MGAAGCGVQAGLLASLMDNNGAYPETTKGQAAGQGCPPAGLSPAAWDEPCLGQSIGTKKKGLERRTGARATRKPLPLLAVHAANDKPATLLTKAGVQRQRDQRHRPPHQKSLPPFTPRNTHPRGEPRPQQPARSDGRPVPAPPPPPRLRQRPPGPPPRRRHICSRPRRAPAARAPPPRPHSPAHR